MRDAAEIAIGLAETCGYDDNDLVFETDGNKDGMISVITIDSITYPIDTEPILARMVSDRTQICILSDGTNIHIFVKDVDSIKEVDRLLSKDKSEQDEVRLENLKKMLRNTLAHCSTTLFSDELHNVMLIIAMGVIAERKDVWDDLESGSMDAWNSCLDEAFPMLTDSKHSVDIYRSEEFRSRLLTPILRLRGSGISGPSPAVAKEILSILSRFYVSGMSGISDDLCRVLLSLASGRTEYNGMGTIMMGVESSRLNKKVDLIGFYDPCYELISSIGGNTCTYTHVTEYPESNYDTILTCPPIGVGNRGDDKRFASRTSEALAVESALSRISPGGRVCAVVPSGFLFSKRDEKLREMITENYRISAIVELEKPFEFSAINMNLIVLDSAKKGTTIVSIKPLKVSNALADSLTSALDGNIDKGLFMTVEQSSLGKIWAPSTIVAEASLSEENDMGICISEVAEVIRGCNIPASRYHPDGSPTGIPYLRISNIKDGMVNLTDAKRVSSQDGKVFSKGGDVVISIQGVVGKIAESGERVFIPSSQVALVRPNEGVDTKELLMSMRSDYFRKQMDANTTGSVIKGLSVKNLSELKVMLEKSEDDNINGGGDSDL